MNIRLLLAALLFHVTLLGAYPALTAARNAVYWTMEDTRDPLNDLIQKAELDGSNVQTLVYDFFPNGFHYAREIDVDTVDSKLYWAESSLGSEAIYRSNLNGTNVEELSISFEFLSQPSGLAIDSSARKVYWTERATGTIKRANLDGSAVEIIAANRSFPTSLDLDLQSGKMYWAEITGDAIYVADLDGSNRQTVIAGLTGPGGIAVDPSVGRVFWTETTRIRSANLDGSDLQTIANSDFAFDIDVDLSTKQLYWTDSQFADRIVRMNYDGSNQQAIVTGLSGSGNGGPVGIVIGPIPEPQTMAMILIGISFSAFYRSVHRRRATQLR